MSGTNRRAESRHHQASGGIWGRTRMLRWIAALLLVAWAAYEFDLPEKFGLTERSMPSFLLPKPHAEVPKYTRLAVGVALADRFKSYQDVSSTLKVLESGGFKEITSRHRRAVESSDYPPYRFDTIRVADYVHLGHVGQMSLQFFNDRLYQVEFVPSDPEEYVRKQRTLGLERDQNARREKIEGSLRIASTVELAVSKVGQHLGTEPFILWQDLRLIQQRDEWDRTFGSIPKKMISG